MKTYYIFAHEYQGALSIELCKSEEEAQMFLRKFVATWWFEMPPNYEEDLLPVNSADDVTPEHIQAYYEYHEEESYWMTSATVED